MVLLVSTKNTLQYLISVCDVHAAGHDIVYNISKTECMIVPPAHHKVAYMSSAKLSEYTLIFVERFTYLGHIINQKMTDDYDIDKQATKLMVTGNMLLIRFSLCSQEVCVVLFRSYCYSTYCNSLRL